MSLHYSIYTLGGTHVVEAFELDGSYNSLGKFKFSPKDLIAVAGTGSTVSLKNQVTDGFIFQNVAVSNLWKENTQSTNWADLADLNTFLAAPVHVGTSIAEINDIGDVNITKPGSNSSIRQSILVYDAVLQKVVLGDSYQDPSSSPGPGGTISAFIDSNFDVISDIIFQQSALKIGTTALTTVGEKLLVSGNIVVNGKVYFKNMFSALADLPSATTYHGMFAHVHATGAAYFAHADNWIRLANQSEIFDGSYTSLSSIPTTFAPSAHTHTASEISDFNTAVSSNSAVAANITKISFPGFGTTAGTALEGNTSLLQLGTSSTTALAGNTAVITSNERTKLSGIAAGAEVNVQSDWDATSGDAQILNKPALGSGTVTSITAGTGLDGGTITGSGTIDLADTAVTAGVYTAANITVDAQGRITSAASGSGGGGGTVTSVAMSVPSGFSISGSPITTSGTLALTVGGNTTQYVDGTGALQTFPSIPPTAPVDSVNGQTGVVVLDTGDISESGNLYYTEARVSANSSVTTLESGLAAEITQRASGDALNQNAINTLGGQISVLSSDIATNTAKVGFTDALADARISAASISALSDVPSIGTAGQVLVVNSGATALEYANQTGGGSGGIGTADQTLNADRTIDTNGFNLDIELDPTGTADTFTIHDGTHDLFQVDTSTSGTLFSVNDVSGLPKLEVDETEGVIAKSIKVEDGGLSSAGSYGKGAEIWYQGTSTPTAGSVYYLDSSGNWANTDASAVATAKGMLSVSAGADSDVDGMVIKGFVYVGTDPGGSVGDVVYLSETANQLTTTPPTTASAVVRVCGYKVGTNVVYFDPSKDWIELS
jgi:hypothetical protein